MQKIAKNCSESDSRHLQPSFPGHFRIVTIVTIVTFCFFVFVMFFLKTPVKYVEASDYGITKTHPQPPPEPTPIPSRGEGRLMCFVDGGWWMENTMLCVFFRTNLTSYFIVLTFLHPPSTFHPSPPPLPWGGVGGGLFRASARRRLRFRLHHLRQPARSRRAGCSCAGGA